MAKLVLQLNETKFKGPKRRKPREELLYDLTMKYQELYAEIENILSGKKGSLRGVYSGRTTFSSRSVIVPEPTLRVDEVILPYQSLVELLQQSIINILQRSYHINYSKAHEIWSDAQRQPNQIVIDIINSMIRAEKKKGKSGLPLLINRNPTIGNNCGFIIVM